MKTKGTILIVEDTQRWQELLSDFLGSEGYTVDVAGGFKEARSKLGEGSFDLATIDLNLTESEPTMKEGMTLLDIISKSYNDMDCLIVTRTGTISLASAAFKTYEIADFVDKDTIDWVEFGRTIEATLLYREAIRLSEKKEWQEVLAKLRQIREIQPGYKDRRGLEYLAKAEQEPKDSVTELPTGEWIYRQLQDLRSKSNWAVLYIGISHIEHFEKTYGFPRVEHVWKFIAMILKEVKAQLGRPEDFIGHMGGNNFILITVPSKAQQLKDEIKGRFDERIESFYSKKHIGEKRQFKVKDDEEVSLMSLAIGIVTDKEGPFYTRDDLVETLEVSRAQDDESA